MNFIDATPQQVDSALREAQLAFLSYKNISGKKKAEFLREIANQIEALGQALVEIFFSSNLPLPKERVN